MQGYAAVTLREYNRTRSRPVTRSFRDEVLLLVEECHRQLPR